MQDLNAEQARALAHQMAGHTPESAVAAIAVGIYNMANDGKFETAVEVRDAGFSDTDRQRVLRHFTDRSFLIRVEPTSSARSNYYCVSWDEAQQQSAIAMANPDPLCSGS